MTVYELIEILKKCDPSVEVSFCNEDTRTDSVEFVEFDITSSNAKEIRRSVFALVEAFDKGNV